MSNKNEEKSNNNSAIQLLEKPEKSTKPAVLEKKEKSVTVVKEQEKSLTNVEKVSEEKKDESKDAKNGLNTISIFAILLGVLVILILCAFLIFSFVMSNNKNIYYGIYIKNIDISDLSKNDAKSRLNNYIDTSLPEEIILSHGDYEVALNTAELNIVFNIDSAIDTAYNLGRNGNIITNGFEIISTMIDNKNIEPTFTLDDEILTNMLNDASSKLPDKVIESGYYIDGNNLILNKGKDGNVINVEKTKKKIKDAIKNLNLINNKIEISVSSASPTKLDIDKIYNEVHKDAIDATFTKEPLAVTPSENGIDFSISLDEAKSKLTEEKQECIIPLKVVYPSITTNMIGTEAFPDKLSDYSTNYAASNVNRTTNLRLAANKINGTVIMPGEIFSYNQVVGERTIAAGYKEAPIYVSGRVEDGLGGRYLSNYNYII